MTDLMTQRPKRRKSNHNFDYFSPEELGVVLPIISTHFGIGSEDAARAILEFNAGNAAVLPEHALAVAQAKEEPAGTESGGAT
jgi:hypothetical protein